MIGPGRNRLGARVMKSLYLLRHALAERGHGLAVRLRPVKRNHCALFLGTLKAPSANTRPSGPRTRIDSLSS